MSSPSWKAHFTQPISGYDPLEAQGLSELGYALQQNQISEEEYLKWARETFELASVDMKFFQSQPAPKELYEKWKDVYPWSPECLPIAEWDDHLLIAALEKPEGVPPELKPIVLLAPIQGLLEYWTQLSESASLEISEASEKVDSGGMPEGLNLDINSTAQSPTNFTGLSFSGVKIASAHNVAPTAKSETETAPPEVKAQPQIISTLNSNEPLAIKIGDDTNIGITIKSPSPAPPVSQSSYTIPPLNPKVPPPTGSNTATTSLTQTAHKSGLEKTAVVASLTEDKLEATIPEIKAQPQILSETGLTPVPSVGATSYEVITIPESELKSVFEEYRKHYEKQVYIEFDENIKLAVAKYWPQDFVATEVPSKHSYQDDSFLAIVAKTQKPYHGYVVVTPVAEKFFQEVNSGHIPENITLVPILKNDVIVGAIMGWGPKSTYNLHVLRDMEKIVRNLQLKFGWITADAA